MAKVTLDILTNAPTVLEDIATANTEVATAAQKAGQAQSKAFNDADKAARKEITTVQGLKKEIRDLESAAIAAGEGTAEFDRNIALAGKRKAELRDLKQAIDALDPDRVAQGFLGAARSAAGFFTVAESGAALLGVRNEELQRSLLKVQAAQGLLAGLQELANSKDELAKLRIIALQKLQTLEIKRGIVATEGATVASRLLALALTPTGIFAIIGAIGALIATVLVYTRETKIATEAEKERSRAIDGTIIKNKELRDSYNDQLTTLNEINNEYLVLLGVLTEYEAAVDNIKAKQRVASQEAENDAKAQIVETESLINTIKNYALAVVSGNLSVAEGAKLSEQKAILDQLAAKQAKINADADIEIQREQLKEKQKNLSAEKKIIKERVKTAKEITSEIAAEFSKFADFGIQQESFIAEETIKSAQSKIDSLLRLNEDRVLSEEDTKNKILKILEELFNETKKQQDEQTEAEKEAARQRLESFNIYANSVGQSIGSLNELQQIQTDNSIKLINAETDARLIAIDKQIEQIRSVDAETESSRKRQEKSIEALEKRKQDIQAESDKKSRDLAKKQFERNKKFNLAQAIISGATAVINAYATEPFIPAGLAAGIAAGVLTGLQIAKIETTTFRKGGYTGDGGVDQEAGTVHKREFVSTAETTKKHRSLLEALHTGDYSELTSMDLAPILKGTGVVLNNEAINNINNTQRIVASNSEARKSEGQRELVKLNKNFNKFFNHQKSQEDDKTMPDGTRIIKKGSTTRIIKKHGKV